MFIVLILINVLLEIFILVKDLIGSCRKKQEKKSGEQVVLPLEKVELCDKSNSTSANLNLNLGDVSGNFPLDKSIQKPKLNSVEEFMVNDDI